MKSCKRKYLKRQSVGASNSSECSDWVFKCQLENKYSEALLESKYFMRVSRFLKNNNLKLINNIPI